MKRAWLALVMLTASIAAAQGPRAPFHFVNTTAAAGLGVTHVSGASPDKYLAETMGSGALFFDYDADDDPDLFIVDGGSLADQKVAALARHRLYRNRGDGTFEDATAGSGIVHRGYGMGACAGDVDNDGRVDLYITSVGPNVLYRNTGGGRFIDVTAASRTGLAVWSTSCGFVDIEGDGDPDLFVVNYLDARRDNNRFCGDAVRRVRVYCHPLNYKGLPAVLYRNDGKGVFTDVSVTSGVSAHSGNGLGIAIGDYDDDGRPDVFVANDGVPNFLFHNEGSGRFAEVALPAGVAVARDGKPRAGMGTEFADYTRDGRLDLIVTNHEFETHSLFRNEGGGLFADATPESGIGPATLPHVGFGTVFADFDNDAALDLAIVNGHVVDNTALFRTGSSHAQRKLLFGGVDGRRFVEQGRNAGPGFAAPGVGRTLIAADIENDGDLDLLVTNNGGAAELLRNESRGGGALVVRLEGMRGNRDALGARLRVTAGGRTLVREVKSGSSYLGQNELRLHVGLGAAPRAERIEVRWPSGAVETIANVAANQRLTIREGGGLVRQAPFARRGP